jgi:hypothetical protein
MEIKKYLFKVCFAFSWMIILLVSCKKDNQGSSTNLPVVQAYLYAGHTLTVKLYQQKSLTDTAKYGAAITGQELYVSDGSNQVKLTESAKGSYTYTDNTFLTEGKTYTLSFNYLSKEVTAKTTMPSKPQNFATQHTTVVYTRPTNVNATSDTLNRFTWDNPDSLNHVLVFDNVDDTFFPLGRATSFSNSNSNIFDINTDRKSAYYVVSNSFPYYGNYQVILLRVNQEYINLLESNILNANSQNLLNVPTNVVNGLGIFTALQADTLSFSLAD